MEIYLQQNAERSGPYTLEKLQAWLEDGQLSVSDAAWFEGCSDWVKVQDIPGVMLPGGDHLVNVSTVPPFEAYHGDEPYVFISYAHKDAAVVYEEIARLHEAGINIWYDEGIEASNEWPEEIARAVVDCTVFLAFISPRSTNSVNCRNEINLALNENKPFLAIHLEETELPLGLRLRMGDLQAILRHKLPVDFYQKKSQDSLKQLLGKKPARSRTRPSIAQKTETSHEPESAEQAVQADAATNSSKPRRTALVVALASVLLIACIVLGFLFFDDDGKETETTEGLHEPDLTAVTFTSSQREGGFGSKLGLRQTKSEGPKVLTPGQPWTVPTGSMEMIWCKPGTFMMGSPESELGHVANETLHEVTLTQGFWLGKYEVTRAQWNKAHKEKHSGEGNLPLAHINWWRVMEFCKNITITERNALRIPHGWKYTLPTEAQWEYACRAGTTTAFAFGGTLSSQQANVDKAARKAIVVGNYPPNAWGFHDMHGNVSEWCSDWYGAYPQGSVSDPLGSNKGGNRVFRGGGWQSSIRSSRSASRQYSFIGRRDHNLGFRLSLQKIQPPKAPEQPAPGQPWTVPSVGLEMIWCEPGTFMMGSPESEVDRHDDETLHEATLTKGFYLGRYEVTQAQWAEVMGRNPSWFKGDDLPVEQVSGVDVKEFCQKITQLEKAGGRIPEGWKYTLPTEAQWEYACRAGTTTAYAFGDTITLLQIANFNKKGKKTKSVGKYPSNAWGFHDMHGNVREWCLDWYEPYAKGPERDPQGPVGGSSSSLVNRGGCWNNVGGRLMRSASRGKSAPDRRLSDLGFRLSLRQVGE